MPWTAGICGPNVTVLPVLVEDSGQQDHDFYRDSIRAVRSIAPK